MDLTCSTLKRQTEDEIEEDSEETTNLHSKKIFLFHKEFEMGKTLNVSFTWITCIKNK